MPRIVTMDEGSIRSAAAIVRRGGLIIYPTDTVYGLGCNPTDEEAVVRLVKEKQRGDRPISVICSSIGAASRLVELNQKALDLAGRHWPGALTIVARLKASLPFPLHLGTGTLGVRVPASAPCRSLAESCGGSLTGTSANISGRPSCRTAADAALQFGDSVDLILDGGRLEGQESTVVQVLGDTIQVLRAGPVGVSVETK